MAELPESVAKWLEGSALQQRQLMALAGGLLVLLMLLPTNQRSIFTPWPERVSAFGAITPAAFLARIPGGFGSGGGGPGGPFQRAGGGTGNPFAPTPGGAGFNLTAAIDGVLPAFGANALAGGGPGFPSDSPFSGLPVSNPSGGNPTSPTAFVDPTTPVPEASTWVMMLLGFGAIGWSLRRRMRVPVAETVAD